MNLSQYSTFTLEIERRMAEARQDWSTAIRITTELARRRKAAHMNGKVA